MKTILYISIFLVFCSCEIENKKTVHVSLKSKFYPERLNPAQIGRFSEDNVYSQIYETLLIIDDDQKTLLPNLARKWHFSDNKTKVEILLQKDVLFHDNTKFSAYSVKKSYKWLISENPSSSLLRMIDSIEVRDSLTLHIHLKYPYAPFLYNLASPFGLNIISENAIEKYKDDLEFHPVGSGPYYLEEWEKLNIIKLRSFEKYWNQTGVVNSIVFKSYSKKYGSENALRDEQADLTFPVIGSVTDRLKLTGLIDYKVNPSLNIIYLGFNNNQSPFKDKNARIAVSKAIHVKKIINYLVSGNAIMADGPIPPHKIEYGKLKQNEYSIMNAKKILQNAGYKNGLQIKFYFPEISTSRFTIVEFIKMELKKIGIILDVILFDNWGEFLTAAKSDSSQMFFDVWGNELVGDAENLLYSLFHSKSQNNLTQYSNLIVDSLLYAARFEYDYNNRQHIYKAIVKEVLNDTPALFLYHVKQHYAYNKHRIKYLPVNPYGIIEFHRIVLNN